MAPQKTPLPAHLHIKPPTRHPELTPILDQLANAIMANPSWPKDPIHAAAKVAEQAGQALQAALDYSHGRCQHTHHLRHQLIHTAATAIRALHNVPFYTTPNKPRPPNHQTRSPHTLTHRR